MPTERAGTKTRREPVHPPKSNGQLPPRLRRTLKHLLSGDSEKVIAQKLGISPHTLHGYVKELYRVMGVRSRAQLMAKALGNRSGS
ncbi:MAG TPA: LuxR C-terminal-related transcriptional regulator [Tepidisphaeraceae bacterium]